jgi:hypothetical protein
MSSKTFLGNIKFQGDNDSTSATDLNANVYITGGVSVAKTLFAGISLNAPVIYEAGLRVATITALPTAGVGLTNTGGSFSVNAAQPGITSLGTLSSLTVTGDVSTAAVPADGAHLVNKLYVDTLAYLTPGTGLTKMGSTISLIAAQAGITSLGTLTGLTSSGIVSITDITDSTSGTTGALLVQGGGSIGRTLSIGHLKSGASNGLLKLLGANNAAGDRWFIGFGHGENSTDANDRARVGVDIASGGSGRLFFTTGPAAIQTQRMFIDENGIVSISTTTDANMWTQTGALFCSGGALFQGSLSCSRLWSNFDNRSIAPASLPGGRWAVGFGSFNNNGGAPYADVITLNNYGEESGGNSNMISVNKATIGMRIYQGTFGSTLAFSTYADVTLTTPSDYRIKENLTPLTGAIQRLSGVKVYRFNYINNPEITVDGFIAHEMEPVVPESVIGEKDAVNDEGIILPQSIDQTRLVPLLTAALQEASIEIDRLRKDVDALKSQL